MCNIIKITHNFILLHKKAKTKLDNIKYLIFVVSTTICGAYNKLLGNVILIE